MAESTLTIKIQDDGDVSGGKSGAGSQPASASPKPTPVPLPTPKPVDLPYPPPAPNPEPGAEKDKEKKKAGFDAKSAISEVVGEIANSIRNPMGSMQGTILKILDKIAEQGKKAEEKMQKPKPVPKPDTAKAVQPATSRIEKTKQIIKQQMEDKKAGGTSMQWDRLRKPESAKRPKPKSIMKPVPRKVPTNMGTKATAGLAVVGRVAGAAGLLVSSIKMMTDAFLERAKELRDYSADIAASGARAEVRGIQADIKEAQTLGPGMARLEDSSDQLWHEVRDILLPIKKFVVDVLAGTMETVLVAAKIIVNSPEIISEAYQQTKAAILSALMGDTAEVVRSIDILAKRIDMIIKTREEKPGDMFDEFFAGPKLVGPKADFGAGGDF